MSFAFIQSESWWGEGEKTLEAVKKKKKKRDHARCSEEMGQRDSQDERIMVMEFIFKTERNRNMEKDGCRAAGDCSDPCWTLCPAVTIPQC